MNNLINDDCINVMKNMDSISIDHIITDIPYDVVSRESNGIRNFDKKEADELTFKLEDFVKEATRITKDKIMIFCSSEQVSDLISLLEKNNFESTLAIWKKTNPSPVNGQYIWLSGVECCVVANRGKLKEELKNLVWSNPSGRSKIHPTEKPLKLMSLIVKNYTKENDLILDPCAGSGSTLEAAKLNNRNWIGIELFKEYYDKIINRIK